jgi:hypothetical protein
MKIKEIDMVQKDRKIERQEGKNTKEWKDIKIAKTGKQIEENRNYMKTARKKDMQIKETE